MAIDALLSFACFTAIFAASGESIQKDDSLRRTAKRFPENDVDSWNQMIYSPANYSRRTFWRAQHWYAN